MTDLTWKPELAKVADLKLWEDNPRKLTEDNFSRLKSRIEKRGFHDVLKTDGKGVILSGNQRKRALEELGIKEVYILVPSRELTLEEKEAVAIESNRSDGIWDFELLNNFDHNFLFDLGFTEPELAGYEEGKSNSAYKATCPHCSKELKLSNRVRRIEAC